MTALERKGLLDRQQDGSDARARQVVVTRKGSALAPRAIAAVEAVDAEFFEPVSLPAAIKLLTGLAGEAV